MTSRFFSVLNACLLSIAVSTNAYAALATADIIVDWSSLVIGTTDDLVVNVSGEADGGTAFAEGGLFDDDSISGFGGINVSSIGSSSSASVVTTSDLIDASAATTLGSAGSRFERSADFNALSGSGVLTLSVDVGVQGEVQGAGSEADATIIFGHGTATAWTGSLASIELRGDAGNQTESLPTTLSFSVPMTQGDAVAMFAEGEIDVSAIPIPPAAWLFGSGLLGLIGIARRRKIV
jgi:hypothetical protein